MDGGSEALAYAHRLFANQGDIAARYLERIAPGRRLGVLDELEDHRS